MIDSNLWILFFSLFLILLLIVLYTLLKATFGFSRRYCMCVKWGSCCCYLKMDWEAYQRERDSLQRLRELRHRHRQLVMHQQLSTFSQIPGAIPDSVYIIPSTTAAGMGFILVPAAAAAAPPRPIREQLTADQRRRILERILVFHPFSADLDGSKPAATTTRMNAPGLAAEDLEANDDAPNGIANKALTDATSEDSSVPIIIPDDDDSSQHDDTHNHVTTAPSLAIPYHEEPIDYENACTICLDSFFEGELISDATDCQHFFHKDCLLGWLDQHDVCPCCRRTMVTEQDWKRIMEEDRLRVQEQVVRLAATAN